MEQLAKMIMIIFDTDAILRVQTFADGGLVVIVVGHHMVDCTSIGFKGKTN